MEQKSSLYICRFCGNQEMVSKPAFCDAEKDPVIRQKILNGSLFTHTCSECSETGLMMFPMIYQDREHHVIMDLCGKKDENLLLDEIRNPINLSQEELESEQIRHVADPAELIEKIHLFEMELDDRAIEIMKLVNRIVISDKHHAKIDKVFLSFEKELPEFAFVVRQKIFGTTPFNREMYDDVLNTFIEGLPDILSQSEDINAEWAAKAVKKVPRS